VAIGFIKKLYRIERQIRSLNDEERRQQRQVQSVPVLQAIKAWLDIQAHAVLPKSALARAVFYALQNWGALCRYTEEGYLKPDNNYAEQSLRPVAVGRKAFPFCGLKTCWPRCRYLLFPGRKLQTQQSEPADLFGLRAQQRAQQAGRAADVGRIYGIKHRPRRLMRSLTIRAILDADIRTDTLFREKCRKFQRNIAPTTRFATGKKCTISAEKADIFQVTENFVGSAGHWNATPQFSGFPTVTYDTENETTPN
jgi:hypothetical protein